MPRLNLGAKEPATTGFFGGVAQVISSWYRNDMKKQNGQEVEIIGADLHTYTVVLEPMDEGGFLVHVPALPEVNTSGDTEEEALVMAQDAIQLVLESRKEIGQKMPADMVGIKMRNVTVRLPAFA
jgi:antitoxin HicB